MQMNDQLRRELTEALAECLRQEIAVRGGLYDWTEVARLAMEFIYGEADKEADDVAEDQNSLGGCRCGDPGPCGDPAAAGITLLGVIPAPVAEEQPPTLDELRSRYVYVVDPQYVTAVPDPAPGSESVQTAP